MNNKLRSVGNILGGPRAEVDKAMLNSAFVETHDFKALVTTNDFNFVVGRRGTGKSALFKKVSSYISKNKIGFVYCKTPTEYETLELFITLTKITEDYNTIRAISRVAWRTSLLIGLLSNIRNHYKYNNNLHYDFLEEFYQNNQNLNNLDCFKRTSTIIKNIKDGLDPLEIPGQIATHYNIEQLQTCLSEFLRSIYKSIFFFFDGLDEGWSPTESHTAIIGGLAYCAADFSEHKTSINVVLFIRDNIFRSLSYFDGDFSRHIEGNTLRLNWDETSLLHLIANRLRVSLNMKKLENDIKVWNRFAQYDLKNKAGFSSCLNYTLYRPRDLIVLLNTSYQLAARGNRPEIIKSDIEVSSKQISIHRLADLLKEYNLVFPGLSHLVDSFNGKPAFQKYNKILENLDHYINECDYTAQDSSDYAILGEGKTAFFALYSIGFLGIENTITRNIQFCHDGSQADIDIKNQEQQVCVHPCYWKSLEIQSDMIEEDVLIEIYDDQKPENSSEIKDLRTKQIGQLVTQLPQMKEGKENATAFENWVLRTIKILFSGELHNPELHPNHNSIQRRDIITTNNSAKGFWKKIREDYKSRQVIFEVKNYSSLKLDDIRQALSYSGQHYGSFIVIVNRNQNEGLSDVEKGWIKEMWDNHKLIVFILPAPLLSRCISKLRNQPRFDYAENQLDKRLDVYLRSYLSLKHIPRRKKVKKK